MIFLQFDGTRDSIYQELRGEPLLEKKNKAIEQCGLAGLPVTLVPTVVRGLNLDNIGEMVDFLLDRLGVVKGIHFQPVSFIGRHGYDEERQKLERVTMFQVMEELERQTGFRISTKGLVPISTGHPLCCFCGTYLRGQDGEIRSMMGEKARKEGVSCCDSADPLSIIRRDRDFVLNKWEVEPAAGWVEEPKSPCCCPTEAKEPEPCCCGGETASQTCCGQEEPDGFDEFLSYIRRNMFTVSGMAFQDLTNLDGERLRRCRVQVYTEEGQLVPFCAHQIHRG